MYIYCFLNSTELLLKNCGGLIPLVRGGNEADRVFTTNLFDKKFNFMIILILVTNTFVVNTKQSFHNKACRFSSFGRATVL
jgi:hypothetical protein